MYCRLGEAYVKEIASSMRMLGLVASTQPMGERTFRNTYDRTLSYPMDI